MLPVLKYLVARLALFVVAVTVLGLLGARRELALFGGLLVSVLLSYLLLRRLRDPATAAVVERVEGRTRRRASRADEDALVEDEQLDDARREGELVEHRVDDDGPQERRGS